MANYKNKEMGEPLFLRQSLAESPRRPLSMTAFTRALHTYVAVTPDDAV